MVGPWPAVVVLWVVGVLSIHDETSDGVEKECEYKPSSWYVNVFDYYSRLGHVLSHAGGGRESDY